MKFIEQALARESLRYLIAGGFNTAATYAAYLLLLPLMGYAAAYTVTYIAGIFLSYFLSARFVFRRPLNWRQALQYPLVYGVQYVLGIGFTALLVEGMEIDAAIAPAFVIVLTLPFTFVLSRWIIKRKADPIPDPSPNSGKGASISVSDADSR